jgi:hypothetical protein
MISTGISTGSRRPVAEKSGTAILGILWALSGKKRTSLTTGPAVRRLRSPSKNRFPGSLSRSYNACRAAAGCSRSSFHLQQAERCDRSSTARPCQKPRIANTDYRPELESAATPLQCANQPQTPRDARAQRPCASHTSLHSLHSTSSLRPACREYRGYTRMLPQH